MVPFRPLGFCVFSRMTSPMFFWKFALCPFWSMMKLSSSTSKLFLTGIGSFGASDDIVLGATDAMPEP